MKGILIVLTLVTGAFLSHSGQVNAQTEKPDKLDCSGRWVLAGALRGAPTTPLEKGVAGAQYVNVGVLIQGGEVEIEQTDHSLKIRQGPHVYSIALDGSESRNVNAQGAQYFSTATWDADKITIVTRRTQNAKTHATHELTMKDGELIVSTSPPFLVGAGTPPPDVLTATLRYKKK